MAHDDARPGRAEGARFGIFRSALIKTNTTCCPDPHDDAYQAIMTNAMEWLLADGVIIIKGEERRVSEVLLGRGGPLFSVEQRQWI